MAQILLLLTSLGSWNAYDLGNPGNSGMMLTEKISHHIIPGYLCQRQYSSFFLRFRNVLPRHIREMPTLAAQGKIPCVVLEYLPTVLCVQGESVILVVRLDLSLGRLS